VEIEFTPWLRLKWNIELIFPEGSIMSGNFNSKGHMRKYLIPILAVMAALTACGPSEKEKADAAEAARIKCLDKLCDGDIEPKLDRNSEVAFKLNGSWYAWPRVNGNPNMGPIAFYWPSKVAAGAPVSKANAPEVQRNEVGAVANFSDVAIEMFVKSVARSVEYPYKELLEEERQGHVVDKRNLRPDLEIWTTSRGGNLKEVWYIATGIKDPSGNPPVIACRGGETVQDSCSGGFVLNSGIGVSVRFRGVHGADWPSIYTEVARVLSTIRKI
jgi:hypothetical protein